MKRIIVLLLLVTLLASPSLAEVLNERISWDQLQEEYDQLIEQIASDNKIIQVCDAYLELLDSEDPDTQKLREAENAFTSLVGNEMILPNIDKTKELIRTYRNVLDIAVNARQEQMLENLKLQSGYYLESIEQEKSAKEKFEAGEGVIKSYPSGSTSKYISEATDQIPAVVFSTTAKENGLSGTVYSTTGTVLEEKTIGSVNMVIVDLNGNTAAIADYIGKVPILAEKGADYTLPSAGELVDLIITYSGFSSILELPIFYLGANEYCVEALRGE